MRLNNLPASSMERVKSGDIMYLKELLYHELEAVKEDLIYLPEAKVSELRGKAIALAVIIKLLP